MYRHGEKSESIIKLWERGMINVEIAELTGLSEQNIRSVLNKRGFKSNRYRKITIDNKLNQLLIGSMLGDGHLCKIESDNQHSRLSIAHGLKQEDYIKWKHDFLLSYKIVGELKKNKYTDSRCKSGFIEEYRFRSKTHPIFTSYRKLYYPNGFKSIINETTKKIDELGLCIWYMDDGNVTTSSFEFNTQSFSKEENNFLIEILKDKFNLDTYLNDRNVIVIRGNSKELFKSIIEKNI